MFVVPLAQSAELALDVHRVEVVLEKVAEV